MLLTRAALAMPPAAKYAVITVAPIRQPVAMRHAGRRCCSTAATPSSWRAEHQQAAEPDDERGQPAHLSAEVVLEKIADRQEVEPLRFAPDARADPEREHERPEARAAVPPPGGKALMVGVAPSRRPSIPAPMLGARNVAKIEPGPERAVADEELRALLRTRRPIQTPSRMRPTA